MPSAPITCFKDLDIGHGPYIPSPAIGLIPPAELPDSLNTSTHARPFACSGNVMAGKKGVHRQGDVRAIHISVSIPPTPEPLGMYAGGKFPWLSGGSKTVRANGKPIGRIGDEIICGSTVATGNLTVFVGD